MKKQEFDSVMYFEDGEICVGLKSQDEFGGAFKTEWNEYVKYYTFAPFALGEFEVGVHGFEVEVSADQVRLRRNIDGVKTLLCEFKNDYRTPLQNSVTNNLRFMLETQLQVMHDEEELPLSCDSDKALGSDDLGEYADFLLSELAKVIIQTKK